MESEFITPKLIGSEADWLRNFLISIPMTKDPLPPVSIHCDCQTEFLLLKINHIIVKVDT